MVVSLIHNAFFLFLILVAVGGSHGWMITTTKRSSSSLMLAINTNAIRRHSSTALGYQNGDELTMPTAQTTYHSTTTSISATVPTSYDESIDDYDHVDELDFDPRLRAALRTARNADRLFGLCTPESVAAWAAVDTMFGLSRAGQEVENCVRNALGHEKSIWSDFEVRA